MPTFQIPTVYTDIDNKFRRDDLGRLKVLRNEEVIIQSIENILLTIFGERVMRPSFGNESIAELFNQITEESAHRLGIHIKNALEQDDRFRVIEINVIGDIRNRNYEVNIRGIVPQINIPFYYHRILSYNPANG